MASRRAKDFDRKRPRLRVDIRLCHVFLPQRKRTRQARFRTLFLSAKDGTLQRSQTLERHLLFLSKLLGYPPRNHPWNRVDRDSPRRIHDGGDSLRAEGALQRIELRKVRSEIIDVNSTDIWYRWDYIFSFIKRRRADRSAVLPDRKDVTMEVAFMDSYVRKLIQTCHK